MVWIIHRANREMIYNTEVCEKIARDKEDICLYEAEGRFYLAFECDKDAEQAFKYLMEAIQRGDRLVNL